MLGMLAGEKTWENPNGGVEGRGVMVNGIDGNVSIYKPTAIKRRGRNNKEKKWWIETG